MTIPEDPEKPDFAQIGQEIMDMTKVDQDMRFGRIPLDPQVDRRNTERMKQIISQIGWPSINNVGTDASDNSWLLVQHADHDVEFQEYCLDLLKSLPKGEIHLQNIAYLEDRVLKNRNQPQLYGTQMDVRVDGVHGPYPMEGNHKQVNERRKKMGLDQPVEVYHYHMMEMYGPKKGDQK